MGPDVAGAGARVIGAYAAACLAVFAFAMTVANVWMWRRGDAGEEGLSGLSVLIPARNEERAIRRALESVVAQAGGLKEVVVYDDGSTDRTAEIVADIQRVHTGLIRIVTGPPLPAGWVGKPHACHRLASAASGDWLLFMDADTELYAGALQRAASLVRRYDLDLLTAVPRQEVGTWLERLVVPFLHVIYASWLPMALVHRSQDPKFLAANGQFLMVSAAGYERCGGFEAVRNAVVDDMAFCANAKAKGLRVLFADGHHLSRCRMYTSASEVWQGFSKNLYEGIGAHPVALLATLALLGSTFVAPFALLAGSAFVPELLAPALIGSAAVLMQRVLLAIRHGHPASSVIFHPIAALAVMAIALNSARWHLNGTVRWAGRTYEGGQRRRSTT